MPPTPSERLQTLGLTLPPAPRPMGSYAPVVVDGDHAWVAGQVPLSDGTVQSPGLVDAEVPVAAAKALARQCALQALSALAASLGSLDRIRQVVRVGVYVASSPGFVGQPEVANGATELLMEVFGEAGRPARVSMGVARLPANAAVEVELAVSLG